MKIFSIRILVGVVVIVGLVSAVQIADPNIQSSAVTAEYNDNPEEFTVDSFDKLYTSDHRTRIYYNRTAKAYPEPIQKDLRWADYYDISDQQFRIEFVSGQGPALVVYYSVDGRWTFNEGEVPRAKNWQPASPAPVGESFSLVDAPRESATISVVEETENTIHVSVNHALIVKDDNATAYVTIEKSSGEIRKIHQITYFEGKTTHKAAIIDRYGAVDVEQPPDAQYSLRAYVYDLKRGPIPLHRWL